MYADSLFGLIAVINSYIGIRQELKAKRTLDELAVLVAPQAKVLRDGELVELRAEEVVPGDLIAIEPGDQLVADGEVISSRGTDARRVDAHRRGRRGPQGDRATGRSPARSASPARATTWSTRSARRATRASSPARRRTFRHPPSPLQDEVNQVIVACLYVMIPLAVVLMLTLKLRSTDISEAAQTATAGLVTLIPEGLVLLMSVTFAVAAVRLAHRDTLVQQMSATESLASVDTICVDKTGHADRRRAAAVRVEVAEGVEEGRRTRRWRDSRPAPGTATGPWRRSPRTYPASADRVRGEVPFSSEWKWSGLRFGGTSYVMGAPDVLERAGALTLPPALQRSLEAKPRPVAGSSPSASRRRRCPPGLRERRRRG